MGAFDEHFKISASRNPAVMSTLDIMTMVHPDMADLVKVMKDDLDQRHITVDEKRGPLSSEGSLSLIFASSDTPSVVVRFGHLDNPPDSAIILRPVARFVYRSERDGQLVERKATKTMETEESRYQAHVLPFAPDIGEVTVEDMVRTMRVLKSEGNEQNFLDIGANPKYLLGQFAFLKGPDGNVITYPENASDPDMAGKPIAFVRDLNCIQGGEKALERMEALGGNADDFVMNVMKHFKEKCTKDGETDNAKLAAMLTNAGIRLPEGPFDPAKASLGIKDLTAAPQECVEACHQQDALVERARAEMTANGVRFDTPSI